MNFDTPQDRRDFTYSVCQMISRVVKTTNFTKLTDDPDFLAIMEEYFSPAQQQSLGIMVMLICDGSFAIIPGYWLRSEYNGLNEEMHHALSSNFKKFRVLRKEKRNKTDIRNLVNNKYQSQLENLKFHKSKSV